uniref:fibrinogen-like protein A isoform X2 n=1 Tax=Styela clava TaxID=7725 RepID=UPI00193957B3|nr:fibrinogen-like protein A isoform X2 [Styela clava]
MNIASLIMAVLGVCACSDALNCIRCQKATCPDITCSGSKIPDECGCCDVCAKQENESCGGPWDSAGICDTGLACVTTETEVSSSNKPTRLLVLAMPFDQSTGKCKTSYRDCNEVCDNTTTITNQPTGFTFYGREAMFIDENTGRGFRAYCDCSSGKNRAWTVIQRRSSNKVSFDKTWEEYEKGFGTPLEDYWLGLHRLHTMTDKQPYEMKINIRFKKSYKTTANFGIVIIGSRETSYQMILGLNTGKLSNAFMRVHNGMKFSTKDNDNDNWSGGNCAKWFGGGWWFNSCTEQNLNGVYYPNSPGPDRITWGGDTSPDIEMIEMKIRPLVY